MWTDSLGAAALAITLPGSAYLATLTLAAGRAGRKGQHPHPSPLPQAGEGGRIAPSPAGREKAGVRVDEAASTPQVVIVVPAHNESLGLLRTLRSLQREVAGCTHTRIVVVADNCSDDTADVALAAGVDVLERHDPQRRGKGHALAFAFATCDDADWFVVIDADTDVEPGFLHAMRRQMLAGADALQCRYRVRDAHASARHLLADVALGAWNVLRPCGRAALGLSAGILGNGFALSRRTLQAVPYSASSIVEDVEYHHLLVQAGLRVQWVDGTEVRGDMPTAAAAAGAQRARWEGGRLRLLATRGPALLRSVLAGQWRLADPLLDLALLPLAWHVALLLAALALGSGGVMLVALASLAAVGLHLQVALRLIGAHRGHWRALLGAPAYIAWKLLLAGATWRASRRHAAWVRSERQAI